MPVFPGPEGRPYSREQIGKVFRRAARYNDAGKKSRRRRTLKKLYNSGGLHGIALPTILIPVNVTHGLLTDYPG